MRPILFQLKNGKRVAALALLELLVVVGLLCLLVAMALPVLRGSGERANAVRCMGNLRQIGIAMAGYCSDHANYLPGPLLPSQGPRYNTVNGAYTSYLPNFLYPYLAIPEPPRGPLPTLEEARQKAPIFYCPSFAGAAKDHFPNSYFMRWKVDGMGGMPPWGSADAVQIPQTPKSLLAVPDRARNWAMCDIDQQCPDLPVTSWYSSLPSRPIHQGARNALFFDWHVGRIDKDGKAL